MERVVTLPGVPSYTMELEWQYMNTDFVVRHEYLTYDYNSFIADVGGYLGLLLGYSILSIYEFLGSCTCKTFKAFDGLKARNVLKTSFERRI